MWWLLWFPAALVIAKLCIKWSCGWCYSRSIMTGKVVVVTGANSGIGFETALNLAKRGAKVILACRNEDRGRAAAQDITNRTKNKYVRFEKLDLSSFKSIRSFVEDLNSTEVKLDVLINNAGMAGFQDKKTEDGLIYDVQTNHFGPFLLTVLLIPLLKKAEAARVITVSSIAHIRGRVNFEKMNEEKHGLLDPFNVYCNNKLCNILFSNELARRLSGTNITSNSLHPGLVRTSIYKNVKVKHFATLVNFIHSTFFKNSLEGAQTSIYLAVSNDVEGVTGKYFEDYKETWTTKKAKDEVLAKQLWEYSEKVTGLAPEERLM